MPADPLREWQERYEAAGTRLGFKPEAGANFSSSVQLICDGPGVVRTTLSPGQVFRDRSMIRDGNDNRSLVVSLGRDLNFWHRNREVSLGRGEATIVQNDQPGAAGARRQFTFFEVSIPQREWAMRTARSRDTLMQVINRQSESLQILLGYLSVLARTGLSSVPETRHAVSNHLIDLTVLTATQSSVGESQVGCVVAARRAAVLEYIASHFQDPALGGSSIAQNLGISQRYLQRLLESSGKSLTEHVNELRLDRAFTLLSGGGGRRVSDIALEVGFSDVGYFHRLFRSRFGDTPRSIRGSLKTLEEKPVKSRRGHMPARCVQWPIAHSSFQRSARASKNLPTASVRVSTEEISAEAGTRYRPGRRSR
jgi:AraC-like DNA-binding protein